MVVRKEDKINKGEFPKKESIEDEADSEEELQDRNLAYQELVEADSADAEEEVVM